MKTKTCPYCNDKIEKFQETVELHKGCAEIVSQPVITFERYFSQFVDEDGNPDPEYEDREQYMKKAWDDCKRIASQPGDAAAGEKQCPLTTGCLDARVECVDLECLDRRR